MNLNTVLMVVACLVAGVELAKLAQKSLAKYQSWRASKTAASNAEAEPDAQASTPLETLIISGVSNLLSTIKTTAGYARQREDALLKDLEDTLARLQAPKAGEGSSASGSAGAGAQPATAAK